MGQAFPQPKPFYMEYYIAYQVTQKLVFLYDHFNKYIFNIDTSVFRNFPSFQTLLIVYIFEKIYFHVRRHLLCLIGSMQSFDYCPARLLFISSPD